MKLGSKNTNLFSTEEQLSTELKEEVKPVAKNTSQEQVHINIEEKLNIEVSRDGAVHSSELTGVLHVLIRDEQFCRVKFLVDCEDTENVQIQVSLTTIK